MRVLSKRTLENFWKAHPDAEASLSSWYAVASKAKWLEPGEIREVYGTASFLPDNRVVFNIGGNKYRLIVHVAYKSGILYVKFIGTHAEYDVIDAKKVGL